jgi:hypothetical protein
MTRRSKRFQLLKCMERPQKWQSRWSLEEFAASAKFIQSIRARTRGRSVHGLRHSSTVAMAGMAAGLNKQPPKSRTSYSAT